MREAETGGEEIFRAQTKFYRNDHLAYKYDSLDKNLYVYRHLVVLLGHILVQ